MRTTMLRTVLVVTGGALLITTACADAGKNPVAPESRVSSRSTRHSSASASSNTVAGTPNKGVVDALAEVSIVTDCSIPLDETGTEVLQTSGHFVVASSGNFHLICHAALLPEIPVVSNALVFTAPCVAPPPGGQSTGHIVITPSQRIHLVCHGKVGDGIEL
jgi:hypothetical protein